MPDRISLLVNGVCGRMGQRVAHLAAADRRFEVVAGLETPQHPKVGQDLGQVTGQSELQGIPITANWPFDRMVDVVIDFSSPDGTQFLLEVCRKDHIPMVVATTGHSIAQRHALDAAGHETPLLVAANLSLGMNLLMKLLAQAASALKEQDF